MKKILFIAIFLLPSFAFAECLVDNNTMGVSGKNCPKDIKDYVERVYGCGHFATEPYDLNDEWGKERKQEIDNAMKELKCEKLEKDKAKIYKKYKRNKVIVKFLNENL